MLAVAKRRFKLESRASARETLNHKPMPGKIEVVRRNEQWLARCGRTCVLDNDPERAMRRLLVRLRASDHSPGAKHDRARLYRFMAVPDCDVVDVQIKSAVDGRCRYVVDFISTAKLYRGDIETLLAGMICKEAGHEQGCSETGD